VYNSAKSAMTGESPFYANYRYELDVYREARLSEVNAQAAMERTDKLKNLHQYLQGTIQERNE
jgi:hypothetical protein